MSNPNMHNDCAKSSGNGGVQAAHIPGQMLVCNMTYQAVNPLSNSAGAVVGVGHEITDIRHHHVCLIPTRSPQLLLCALNRCAVRHVGRPVTERSCIPHMHMWAWSAVNSSHQRSIVS